MSEGTAFKHISVVAEPEEDMVIEAGVTRHVVPAPTMPGPEAAPPAVPAQKPAADAPAQKIAEAAPAVEEKPAKVSGAAGEKAAGGDRGKRAAADDDYRDPTLDDLKGAPMPMAQKIVIVAAVVLIVIAVVYCTLFMG